MISAEELHKKYDINGEQQTQIRKALEYIDGKVQEAAEAGEYGVNIVDACMPHWNRMDDVKIRLQKLGYKVVIKGSLDQYFTINWRNKNDTTKSD